MNTCFNFRNGCNNSATTEFCPECLANGGIHKRSIVRRGIVKRLYNSIAVVLEPVKTNEQYRNLYSNGYIYYWSARIGFKRNQ